MRRCGSAPATTWSASSPTDGTLYVTRHIGYLESTGLVDYAALPEPQSPGLLSGSASWTDLLVPGLVLIACLLIATLIGRT